MRERLCWQAGALHVMRRVPAQGLSIVWFTMNNATLAIACTAVAITTFIVVGGYVALYLVRLNLTSQRRVRERLASLKQRPQGQQKENE